LEIAVDSRGQHECPDVELPVLVQQWLLNVLLDDVTPLFTIGVLLVAVDNAFNVTQLFANINSTASIRVLARLYDPQRRAELGVPTEVWTLLGVVENILELFKV
jgi:hypothetical protein